MEDGQKFGGGGNRGSSHRGDLDALGVTSVGAAMSKQFGTEEFWRLITGFLFLILCMIVLAAALGVFNPIFGQANAVNKVKYQKDVSGDSSKYSYIENDSLFLTKLAALVAPFLRADSGRVPVLNAVTTISGPNGAMEFSDSVIYFDYDSSGGAVTAWLGGHGAGARWGGVAKDSVQITLDGTNWYTLLTTATGGGGGSSAWADMSDYLRPLGDQYIVIHGLGTTDSLTLTPWAIHTPSTSFMIGDTLHLIFTIGSDTVSVDSNKVTKLTGDLLIDADSSSDGLARFSGWGGGVRFSRADNKMQYTNDFLTWTDIGTGGGGSDSDWISIGVDSIRKYGGDYIFFVDTTWFKGKIRADHIMPADSGFLTLGDPDSVSLIVYGDKVVWWGIELDSAFVDSLRNGDFYGIETDIDSTMIADGAVSSADLRDTSVTGDKIANERIDSTKIKDGAIGSGDIGTGRITSTHILDATVALGDMAANSVDSTKITDGGVGYADLGTGAVNRIVATKVDAATLADSCTKYDTTNTASWTEINAKGYLTSETGDISSVALGNGGTGDGTTGAVTLNVVAGTSTGLTVNADSVYIATMGVTTKELHFISVAAQDHILEDNIVASLPAFDKNTKAMYLVRDSSLAAGSDTLEFDLWLPSGITQCDSIRILYSTSSATAGTSKIDAVDIAVTADRGVTIATSQSSSSTDQAATARTPLVFDLSNDGDFNSGEEVVITLITAYGSAGQWTKIWDIVGYFK